MIDGDRGQPPADTKQLVEALLATSRALVAVAAHSLGAWKGHLTLTQYRLLVVLSARGALRVADVADALAITPPNGTRICDRLVQKGLVRRSRSPMDRRSVRISLTDKGREAVRQVSAARRMELSRIVEQMPVHGHAEFIDGLRAFSTAAGQASQDDWALGWGQ